jgi:hypothetical protein
MASETILRQQLYTTTMASANRHELNNWKYQQRNGFFDEVRVEML